MTFSSCLHDQQDLCWENTLGDTSEEPQELQHTFFYQISAMQVSTIPLLVTMNRKMKKPKKVTGQIKFSAVTIKQRIKLV